MAEQAPTDSMLKEAALMLQTLVDELSQLEAIQVTVLLDKCYQTQVRLPSSIACCFIEKNQSLISSLSNLLAEYDAVWPIAPESDGVLFDISRMAELQSCQLLNSRSSAIALCADKLRTCQFLNKQNISVVKSIVLSEFQHQFVAPWVIKPKAAEACEQTFLVNSAEQLVKIKRQLYQHDDYIIQPFVVGDNLSLSCLFYQQKAILLCCNQQIIQTQQQKFTLQACIVNVPVKELQLYQTLINRLAENITGLWGYVGIDIIQPQFAEPLLLEINPRLTTSFAGISSALGVNVAEQVINMIEHEPLLHPSSNQQYTVSII